MEDSPIKVSQESARPSSSVDLLQQAARQNKELAAPSSSKKPKMSRIKPPAATVETAASTAPVSTSVKPDPAQEPSNNVLDIPLNLGSSQTTVQATVEPDKPAKTPARTRKKKPATSKSTPATPTKQPVPTEPAAMEEPVAQFTPEDEAEEDAADAELEYAVKMLQEAKTEAQTGRVIPTTAAKNKPAKVPAANKAFNPNAFRPGVEWQASKSTHFDIYTQKNPSGQIGTANMALIFETAYDTLRRFVPWMMAGKVRVFVYQDHNSYLRHEPNAKAWQRAVAYPTRGEIVVYDEPGKAQELKEVFSHELTHIFTQQFFDKHHTGRIMTPTWLDEGLAVLVEDQMFSGKAGGPWNHDYQTLRFERDPKTLPATFGSSSMFGSKPKTFVPISQRGSARTGRPVRLMAFEDFMKEGSLDAASGQDQLQNWYLQAYLMVRFLLSPNGNTPSNRMQFEQFTRLVADGEAVRNPSTGFLVKDSRGKQVYAPYDVEKALGKAYRYSNTANFEDNFWKWLGK